MKSNGPALLQPNRKRQGNWPHEAARLRLIGLQILEGEKGKMSTTGLAAVMLMVLFVALVMTYWRQIAVFVLCVVVAVFCFGIYFILSIIAP
jgi:hypothetical protein